MDHKEGGWISLGNEPSTSSFCPLTVNVDDAAAGEPHRTAIQIGEELGSLASIEIRALHKALASRLRHRGIHEARKSIRGLRALLALGHSPIASEAAQVDRDLKAMATGLSALRDAHVAVEMASRVVRNTQNAERHARWMAVRRQLMVQRNGLLADVMKSDPGFAQRIEDLMRIRQAVAELPWTLVKASDVKNALSQSLRRAKKAERVAESDDADDEQRHRWRRRLRRLRMQRSALKAIQKKRQRAHAGDEAARILAWLRREGPRPWQMAHATDAVGAEQDLRLLSAAVNRLPSDAITDEAQHDLTRMLSEE